MTLFLCKLWPYLVGGLIGWLFSGWLARRLKHGEPPEQKIVEKKIEVEKIVDNPEHLALLSTLKEENHQIGVLQARLKTMEKIESEVIEKVVEVEKIVDNPEHLSLINQLKSENSQIVDLQARITSFENAEPNVIEKEVEKIVEVDNPEQLKRITDLEEENNQIAGLRSRITELENREPETIEKTVEKIVEKNIEVDNPQHLLKIGELENEIEGWKRGPAINLPAARSAGIQIQREDDFTAIEGVGPKISELIHADGIHSFRQLSETDPATIQKILDKAGANFQMANPGTWPDQANLAAGNRWPALKALQDILDGGVYPDLNTSADKTEATKTVDNPEHVARISALESELEALRKEPELDLDLAKAAGFNVNRQGNQDDFTVVEGIGPKINELIHTAGVHTYKELAGTDVEKLQNILDQAGSNFALARPDTWPDQSELAAENRWGILRKWQDVLDGGEE